MRTDEYGNECPSTLGEYLSIVKAVFGEDSKASTFLSSKIQEQGADALVVATDDQMRQMLFSLCLSEDGGEQNAAQ